jgi:tetratricopeptide (TPR) repeat protein
MEYFDRIWQLLWDQRQIIGLLSALVALITVPYSVWKFFRPDKSASAEDIAVALIEKGVAHDSQSLRQQLQEWDQQVKALTRTIKELQAGAKADKPGMEDALSALKQGDAEKAEVLFDQIAEEKAAEGESANKEAARALINKGNLLFLHDTRAAMDAYAKATKLDPNDPEGWNQLSALQLRIGAANDAIYSLECMRRLGVQLADKECVAAATGNLATIYRLRGELDKAEELVLANLDVHKELEKVEGIVADFGNLGAIYLARGELLRGKRMFKEGLKLAEEANDKEGISACSSNLGLIYSDLGNLSKAERMFQLCHNTSQEICHKEGEAISLGNLGTIYQKRGEFDRAEKMFLKSLAIEKQLGRIEGIAQDYGNLAGLFYDKGDFSRACENWGRALFLFRKIGSPTAEQVEGWMRDAGCPQV